MEAGDSDVRETTSCGGVVWRVIDGDLQLLLIKQFASSSSWGIPKGHQHPGETLEQCALREIKEEAGVSVELGMRLHDVRARYKDELKTVASWLAHVVGDEEPKHDDPDSEVADARWFSAHSLPRLVAYQQPLVSSAIEQLRRGLIHNK